MITAERGLDFVTLPAGEDPDSLVRQRGAGAFQALLDAARPMVERLFDLLRAPGGEATPELRAALLKRLDEAAGRIQDRALAAEYRRALRDRFYAATRPAARGRFAPAETTRPPRPRPETGMAEAERLRVLTAILLRHPVIWADVGHAFAGLALDARLEGLRDALGAWMENAETLDSAALISHLDSLGLLDAVAGVLAASPVPLPGCAQAGAMPAEAEAGWWHIFGLLNVTRLRHEVRQSQDRLACDMTRDNLARHQALTEALLKVESGESDGLDMTA
jgi:DNA primase